MLKKFKGHILLYVYHYVNFQTVFHYFSINFPFPDKCLDIFKIYLVDTYQTLQFVAKDDTISYQFLQFQSVETMYETLSESKNSKHSLIHVNGFPEYYLKQANDMFADLVKQYNAVPMGSVKDSCIEKMFFNKVKNRNLNIISSYHPQQLKN